MSAVARQPKVCGITSLGYDHTDVLGESLKDITWHKSGISKVNIMTCCIVLYLFLSKAGVPLIVSSQAPEALEEILSRSSELKVSSLHIAPPSNSYFDTLTGKL